MSFDPLDDAPKNRSPQGYRPGASEGNQYIMRDSKASPPARQGGAADAGLAIRATLRLFVAPGQVTEIRPLFPATRGSKAGTRGRARCFADGDAAAAYAAKLDAAGKASGLYFVPNAIRPGTGHRTSCADADVARRLWLHIDLDPKRDTGICATDAEKAASGPRAAAIKAWLTARGWPEPIEGDSGNGRYLCYRIDLPNDDAAADLIRDVLQALSREFTDAAVQIDTSMFNASRIIRLFGTMNRKGPDSPERPHRRSGILRIPEVLTIVPTGLLEALAEEGRAPAALTPTGDRDEEVERQRSAGAGARAPAGTNGRAWVGTTVADDFAGRAKWAEILTGWTICETRADGEVRWTRPGKRVEDGLSATTGHEGRDVFHVFSNEARPFAPNESYSKFQAYALLKHGGNESKAAAELYKAGYGTRQPPPPPTDDDRPEWHKDRAGFLDDVPSGPPTNGWHDPEATGRVAPPGPEPGVVAALIEEAKTFRSEREVLSAEDFLSACARLDRKGLDRVAAVIKDRKLGPRAFRRAVAAGRSKRAGTAGADDHPYVEHGDETYMTFVTKEGEIAERRIADFTARIVREVERHEAGERRFQFEIEATHRTGVVARATVDAEQYAKMGWVESLGSLFKVMEGRGDRGHLKLAIQFLSWQEADVPRETVYTSMGWIEHEGEWLYLHAGGALGAFGPSDAVRVEVPRPFARYTLPDPGEGPEEIQAAIAACFGILALAKADRPGAAAVAAILATLPWRAPLGPSDFTIHFGGGSGNYKTSAAKIACQHFAPGSTGIPSRRSPGRARPPASSGPHSTAPIPCS